MSESLKDALEALCVEWTDYDRARAAKLDDAAVTVRVGCARRLRAILAAHPSQEEREAFVAALEWAFPLGLGDQRALAEAEAARRYGAPSQEAAEPRRTTYPRSPSERKAVADIIQKTHDAATAESPKERRLICQKCGWVGSKQDLYPWSGEALKWHSLPNGNLCGPVVEASEGQGGE